MIEPSMSRVCTKNAQLLGARRRSYWTYEAEERKAADGHFSCKPFGAWLSGRSALWLRRNPAKAKTINKILGKDFIVKASVGHVKDLPEKNLGVDVIKDFAPQYVVIPGKEKIIRELKKASKEAEKIYLAPDPEREGEAIAWHIATEIADKKSKTLNDRIYRIIFNEITTRAVQEAIQNSA